MQQGPTVSRRHAIGLGAGLAAAGLGGGPAAAQRRMEILVAYYGALLNTSVVAIGLERGDYATPTVRVTDAVSTIGGGTAIRNMVGGGLHYGIVGTSAALTAMREGIDVRIVHGVIRTMQDLFWVTMPNSPVRSIADLAGKKIAITQPRSVSETMVQWMLERHGLTGRVEVVALGSVGAGLSGLERGAVDAALILEPLWSARQGRYRVAFTLEELPPMMQMVGVATGEMMRDRPDELRDLVKAWRQIVEFVYASPDEAAQLISRRIGATTLPLPVATSAVRNMVGIRYWSRGEVDFAGLDQWVRAMERQGEWQGAADWSRMVDQSFLAADLRA